MMQPNNAANSYLRTKVMTANPQELRLMLYEGAIKFCHQGRQAIDEKRIEDSHNALMRAQKIVLELSTSLRHEVAPDLCQRLNALYTYIYRLLIDANMRKEIRLVDEALKLLEYEKETWRLLMSKAVDESGPTSEPVAATPQTQQTAISSLSVNG